MVNGDAHIAVVEDEPHFRSMVVRTLRTAGFRVTGYATGGAALEGMVADTPALALLDLRLPDIDGLSLMQTIRARLGIGVIIVSGLGELSDVVKGLELGADDYLAKPLATRELIARVRSVLRRAAVTPVAAPPPTIVRFQGWQLNRATRAVSDADGVPIELTDGEYRLLEALAGHPNEVLSRESLMELCYGGAKPAFGRAIDIGVTRLRRKLGERQGGGALISTVRNRGYLFAASAEFEQAS